MTADPELSMGEIEALALKAARGAGLDWGLAEEAATAARGLAEAGIDGLTLLSRVLDGRFAGAVSIAPPVFRDGGWTSGTATPLCPITTGAVLNDHFALPQGPMAGTVRLRALSCPALILPLVAGAGARSNAVVVVSWSGCQVILAAGGILAIQGAAALTIELADEVTITASPALGQLSARLPVPPAVRLALDAHAQRTLVPASDQSRLGAGAAGIDDP